MCTIIFRKSDPILLTFQSIEPDSPGHQWCPAKGQGTRTQTEIHEVSPKYEGKFI